MEWRIINFQNINKMKTIFKYFSYVMAVAIGLIACSEKDSDVPYKFPVPENYMLQLLSQDVQKSATTRTFTLVLATNGLTSPTSGSGQYLSVEFISNRLNYFLAPGNYTIAEQSVAKAGNYVIGYDNGGTYWVDVANGAETKKLKITDGTIIVKREGDVYTISSTVMLEDGVMIDINYAGTIVFEPDPPAYTYTLEVQKPYAWTPDGNTWISVSGSQLNKISVSSEGIPVAYLEIVTAEDPASLAGTYPVKAVNSLENAIVQGQYMDIAWLGAPFSMVIESGSWYIGAIDKMFIRDGNINITDNGGVLTITGSGLGIQDVSTQGAFGNLSTPGSVDYQEVTREMVHSYTYTKTVTAPYAWTMDGQNFTPVPGSQLNTIVISDNGIPAATFEIVTEENTASLSGVFPVKAVNSPERAIVQGQYINLLWMAMFDMAIESGSRYIEGGETMYVRDGNITITDNGGVLTITGSSLSLQDVSTELAFGNLPAPGSVNYQNVTP
jgi:hypothetical protein